MSPPRNLEETIERWFAAEAKQTRRPDFGDKTTRNLYAVQLAREIRRHATVVRKT